jgi:hypothetical protein
MLFTALHKKNSTSISISPIALGVYAHFSEKSNVGDDSSCQTINVVFNVRSATMPPSISLEKQHDDCWFVETIHEDFRGYVKRYLIDSEYMS